MTGARPMCVADDLLDRAVADLATDSAGSLSSCKALPATRRTMSRR
ncbi:hypothetical protein [Streptomyces canus]